MERQEKKILFGLLLFVVIGIVSSIGIRSLMLIDSKETFAIYVGNRIGSGLVENYFLFKAENGRSYKSSVDYNEMINLGDTVWIKYSVNDPEIIEVIDKDYKKYMNKD